MLQAKDLMMGDWVRSKNYDEEYINTRIEALDCRGITKHIVSSNRWIDDDIFEPIPLSKEILLKNGFENIEGNLYRSGIIQIRLAMPRINLPHSFVYIFSAEEGRASIQMVCCDYVHTLQHALRLYGLEEFADNFKV